MKANRDFDIDVIRGFCILSMVFGHFAAQNIVSRAIHFSPYFDGASGFVCLSGLVLGKVVRKRLATGGLGHATRLNIKRTFEIYLFHLLIVFCYIISLMLLEGAEHGVDSSDKATGLIFQGLMLELAPIGGSVLRLYVALLAILTPVIFLASRDRWAAILLYTSAFYLIAAIFPLPFTFEGADGVDGANWGMWVPLFILPFIIGWHWDIWRIRPIILDHKLTFIASGILLIVLSWIVHRSDYGEWVDYYLFDKRRCGLGRMLFAFYLIAVAVALTAVAKPYIAVLLRILATVGQKSLDAYIIQSLFLVSLPLVSWQGKEVLNGLPTAIGVFLFCHAWSIWRLRVKGQSMAS